MVKRLLTFIMLQCIMGVAFAANYLTFTAEEEGSSFGIINYHDNNPDVQYSLDGGKTWTQLVEGEMITLEQKGSKALLKGKNPEGFSRKYDKNTKFIMTGLIAASGSVMSLIDEEGSCKKIPTGPNDQVTNIGDCFASLFSYCKSLTRAPELTVTTLAEGCYRDMFRGCENLDKAPELPVKELAYDCYNGMFAECTKLKSAPELPATSLNTGCYKNMFLGCTSLTDAPELPATIFYEKVGMYGAKEATWCYKEMFRGCTNLVNAPELPATVLSEGCYENMFCGCTSLVNAPELPADNLSPWCYYGMFSDCTNLTNAPKLPATKSKDCCYKKMFSNCTSLTKAPTIHSALLSEDCCYEMFSGCTNLSEISVTFSTWGIMTNYANPSANTWSTQDWVTNVASTGTFYCPDDLPEEYGSNRIPKGWIVKNIKEKQEEQEEQEMPQSTENLLTFRAEEDESSFGIENHGGNKPNIQYSTNGGKTWKTLKNGEIISLKQKGDSVLLWGNNPEGFSKGENEFSQFIMTGSIVAKGNVMSLIESTNKCDKIPCDYCFYRLFSDCDALIQAPELPASVLTDGCYMEMFSRCTMMKEAPKLPALSLPEHCYFSMFSYCTNLTQAPELPATSLNIACYSDMFFNCTNLSKIKVKFTQWVKWTTLDWVSKVALTGTFICPKELPEEYGDSRIPEGWEIEYQEVGVEETASFPSLSVYTSGLTIFISGAKTTIEVYDLTGKLVARRNGGEDVEIAVPQKGVYLVKVGKRSQKVEL